MRALKSRDLGEGDGHESLVVNRSESPAAFRLEHTDHPQNLVLEAHGLAHRLPIAEQVLGHVRAQHGHRLAGPLLRFGEEGALDRTLIGEREVCRGRARDLAELAGCRCNQLRQTR